jgi:hypothetical protein
MIKKKGKKLHSNLFKTHRKKMKTYQISIRTTTVSTPLTTESEIHSSIEVGHLSIIMSLCSTFISKTKINPLWRSKMRSKVSNLIKIQKVFLMLKNKKKFLTTRFSTMISYQRNLELLTLRKLKT